MKPLLALALLALPACSLVNGDADFPDKTCRAAIYEDPTVQTLQQQIGAGTSLYATGERLSIAKHAAYRRCMTPTTGRRYGVAPVSP